MITNVGIAIYQSIGTYRGLTETDVSTDLRKLLEILRREDPDLAAALGWSVQARDVDHLSVTLQCLPQTAAKICRYSKLSVEECPTTILRPNF